MFVTVTKGEISSHFSSLWGRFKPKNFLKILVKCVGQFRYGPLFHDMHIATFFFKIQVKCTIYIQTHCRSNGEKGV